MICSETLTIFFSESNGVMKLAALFPCLAIVTSKVEGSPHDESTPWLPTAILESALMYVAWSKISSVSTSSLFFAARSCELFTWCTLFCQDSETTFSFWFVIADPYLDHSDRGTTKKCWTRQLRGNFLSDKNGVTVSAWPVNSYFPQRSTDDFLDGFYTGHWDETLHLGGVSGHYGAFFLIDLGAELYVRRIKIYNPTIHHLYDERFRNISIRLGNTGGDFSENPEIGFFEGPPTGFAFSFVVKLKVPQLGRYLSAQSLSSEDFQVGHVQVHTFTKEEYLAHHKNY